MTAALPPLGISHLNLPARDPAALADWYVETLGFVRGLALDSGARFVWSAGTLLTLMPGEPLAGAPLHFGFRVESLGALVAWVEALRERGVEVGEIEGDETYSTAGFDDPEGNAIELFFEAPPPGG
jgi:catechol 2,3-dioxygenase-like lactoylglutathione lyase family enzyme